MSANTYASYTHDIFSNPISHSQIEDYSFVGEFNDPNLDHYTISNNHNNFNHIGNSDYNNNNNNYDDDDFLNSAFHHTSQLEGLPVQEMEDLYQIFAQPDGTLQEMNDEVGTSTTFDDAYNNSSGNSTGLFHTLQAHNPVSDNSSEVRVSPMAYQNSDDFNESDTGTSTSAGTTNITNITNVNTDSPNNNHLSSILNDEFLENFGLDNGDVSSHQPIPSISNNTVSSIPTTSNIVPFNQDSKSGFFVFSLNSTKPKATPKRNKGKGSNNDESIMTIFNKILFSAFLNERETMETNPHKVNQVRSSFKDGEVSLTSTHRYFSNLELLISTERENPNAFVLIFLVTIKCLGGDHSTFKDMFDLKTKLDLISKIRYFMLECGFQFGSTDLSEGAREGLLDNSNNDALLTHTVEGYGKRGNLKTRNKFTFAFRKVDEALLSSDKPVLNCAIGVTSTIDEEKVVLKKPKVISPSHSSVEKPAKNLSRLAEKKKSQNKK